MPATTHIFIHSFGEEEDVLFSFGIHVKRDDDFMETQSISHALPNTRRTQFVLYLEFSLSMHCPGCVCVSIGYVEMLRTRLGWRTMSAGLIDSSDGIVVVGSKRHETRINRRRISPRAIEYSVRILQHIPCWMQS